MCDKILRPIVEPVTTPGLEREEEGPGPATSPQDAWVDSPEGLVDAPGLITHTPGPTDGDV